MNYRTVDISTSAARLAARAVSPLLRRACEHVSLADAYRTIGDTETARRMLARAHLLVTEYEAQHALRALRSAV